MIIIILMDSIRVIRKDHKKKVIHNAINQINNRNLINFFGLL